MKDPWHYRNKAQFPMGKSKDGRIIAGFYAGRTHSIIDNRQCEIGIDENRYILDAVISWMEECGVSPYNEADGTGEVRHVMTRAGFSTGELMVVIVAAVSKLKDEDVLVEKLLGAEQNRNRFGISGIVLNINKKRTNVILGRKPGSVWDGLHRGLHGASEVPDLLPEHFTR